QRRVWEPDAGLQLSLFSQLCRVGDQHDAFLVKELLARGIHLPALGGSVRLLEEPPVRPHEPYGSIDAIDDFELAAVRVGERSAVPQHDTIRPDQVQVDGVRHRATVLVMTDGAAPRDAFRIRTATPVEDVELLGTDFAGQSGGHRWVQPP